MAASNLTATPPNGASAANGDSQKKTAKSKNALRRQKAKAKKAHGGDQSDRAGSVATTGYGTETDAETDHEAVVTPSASVDDLTIDTSDPTYAQFAEIFGKFQGTDAQDATEETQDEGPKKAEIIYSDEEDDDEDERERALTNAQKLSKKKKRQMAKLSVAELKTLVSKPEVVEWFDTDARDPRLLVGLKSYRNTVPVPVHWSQKREYLQGKRGIEKPPFQLPPWIADTGIADQRDAIKEKESGMSLKQKTRERVQPKMGKIDIDYQKLHDAFFKFQTKPKMSKFGEAYYEGKELETDLRMKKPGELSEELKEALSIPPLAPPPWLIAMQRYGPPPSYPNLRIPGLNAPIPPGAQWGFHPGGWGRPPVDEYQRPLYGDPFGVLGDQSQGNADDVEKDLWGSLEPEAEESEEEEEEEEDEEDLLDSGHAPDEGLQTPSGLATPSGMNSVTSTVPGGLATPDFLQLRKDTRAESDVSATPVPRDLYQVIPERQVSSSGFMGSSTAYDISSINAPSQGARVLGQDDRGTKRKADAAVSIDPEALEGMSQEQLQAQYDASRAPTSKVYVPGADANRSEFDDVIAKESAKRTKTREKERERGGRDKEKFKF
ncbi:hypothetical protein QFC19_002779 [Naganishia cerealis]|uniref:Uncharacterized protein n=1 Tax=Naganishia cerealis TaxID=610337 RepID=A0ACC2W801_9TREE|nr:hypothetical protein QFC19_002779 [Naganishia cerealis]